MILSETNQKNIEITCEFTNLRISSQFWTNGTKEGNKIVNIKEVWGLIRTPPRGKHTHLGVLKGCEPGKGQTFGKTRGVIEPSQGHTHSRESKR